MLLARDASGEIVKERESADGNQQISTAQKPTTLNSTIQKALASIDSYVFDNKELIELKRGDLLESQQVLSDLKQEEQVTSNFVETLLPHYLGRIYEQ